MTLNIILQPSGSSSHTLPAHTSITSILFTSPKPCTPTHSLPLTRDLGSWIQVALDELDKLRTLSTWRTHQQMPANVLLSSCRPWWGSCGPDPSYSSQVFADSHLFLVIQSTTIPRNFPTESLTLDTWQQVPHLLSLFLSHLHCSLPWPFPETISTHDDPALPASLFPVHTNLVSVLITHHKKSWWPCRLINPIDLYPSFSPLTSSLEAHSIQYHFSLERPSPWLWQCTSVCFSQCLWSVFCVSLWTPLGLPIRHNHCSRLSWSISPFSDALSSMTLTSKH